MPSRFVSLSPATGRRIAAAEQQVKAIDEDRDQAERVVKERETLMWQVGDLMGQWEAG